MWLLEILKVCLEQQLLIKYYEVKAFIIAKNSKYDGHQRGLASMVSKFFDKKSATSGHTINNLKNVKNIQHLGC